MKSIQNDSSKIVGNVLISSRLMTIGNEKRRTDSRLKCGQFNAFDNHVLKWTLRWSYVRFVLFKIPREKNCQQLCNFHFQRNGSVRYSNVAIIARRKPSIVRHSICVCFSYFSSHVLLVASLSVRCFCFHVVLLPLLIDLLKRFKRFLSVCMNFIFALGKLFDATDEKKKNARRNGEKARCTQFVYQVSSAQKLMNLSHIVFI